MTTFIGSEAQKITEWTNRQSEFSLERKREREYAKNQRKSISISLKHDGKTVEQSNV